MITLTSIAHVAVPAGQGRDESGGASAGGPTQGGAAAASPAVAVRLHLVTFCERGSLDCGLSLAEVKRHSTPSANAYRSFGPFSPADPAANRAAGGGKAQRLVVLPAGDEHCSVSNRTDA